MRFPLFYVSDQACGMYRIFAVFSCCLPNNYLSFPFSILFRIYALSLWVFHFLCFWSGFWNVFHTYCLFLLSCWRLRIILFLKTLLRFYVLSLWASTFYISAFLSGTYSIFTLSLLSVFQGAVSFLFSCFLGCTLEKNNIFPNNHTNRC